MEQKSDDTSSIKNDLKNQMENFQCPFTWEMDDIDKSVEYQYNPNDDEELFPLLKLMRNIMTIYVKTNENDDYQKIVDYLKLCDEILVTLEKRNDSDISIKVVSHVLQATKYHVFLKKNIIDECQETLDNIQDLETITKKEKSTLYACRSICWSKYHRIGAHEAEKFIRLAIKENSNCDLWWFILAKNLRRLRRDITINSEPGEEEANSFLEAYRMSQNPVYGIFLAQMYREKKNYRLAIKMYDRVHHTYPKSNTILLRLALGFIHYKKFDKAKECLDKVAKECPTLSMYLHYQGIYYLKENEYDKALPYFEEAIKVDNLPAEKQYLTCLLKMKKSFDLLQYLLSMIERYKNLPEEQIQSLILDVAFTYWKKHNDIEKALHYFLSAVEIDPKASCLTSYYFNANVIPIKDKNVFRILARDFLPTVYQQYKFTESVIDEAKRLKDYCNSYHDKQIELATKSLSKINWKNDK